MNKTNYDNQQSTIVRGQQSLVNGRWKIFCVCLSLVMCAGDVIAIGEDSPEEHTFNSGTSDSRENPKAKEMTWADYKREMNRRKSVNAERRRGERFKITDEELCFELPFSVPDECSFSAISLKISHGDRKESKQQQKKDLEVLLSKCPDLTTLEIESCRKLKEIPENIGNLKNLTSLLIRDCDSLEKIPESIGNLKNLTSLLICRCENLKKIPESIGNLENLTTLRILDCDSLEKIPESIGNLKNLTTLNIGFFRNSKKIPESIGNLENLKDLKIESFDMLKDEIPESIGNLKNLTTLKIFNCKSLEKIPESIGNLKNLTTLKIFSCNGLKEIPESIGNLENLTSLDLSLCSKLEKIPESIGNLENLTTLNLDLCESLNKIPESIGKLTNFTTLDISFCKSLKELPKEFENLINLKEVKYNREIRIPEIDTSVYAYVSTRNLSGEALARAQQNDQRRRFPQVLNLGNRYLTKVPYNIVDSNPKQLILRKNGLSDFPYFISNLSRLEEIDLRDNPKIDSIDKVHDAVFVLPNLKSITLTENGKDRTYGKEELAETRKERIKRISKALHELDDDLSQATAIYLTSGKNKRAISNQVMQDHMNSYSKLEAKRRLLKELLGRLKKVAN